MSAQGREAHGNAHEAAETTGRLFCGTFGSVLFRNAIIKDFTGGLNAALANIEERCHLC